jgi:hypothetical protein
MLVSFWHEQFPFENCCTWTLSAAYQKNKSANIICFFQSADKDANTL